MKFQNNNIDQLTEELNELRLKIAKMNARRNAQISLLKRDMGDRYSRGGTFLKSYHLYPNLYYDSPSYYRRYSGLYPRYRSLENLLMPDSYYEKQHRTAVAFTADDPDDTSNLKSSKVTSASMSDLLGKLKDFVFEQEKQLTDDLLDRIAQSRRTESLMQDATPSYSSSKDLTQSGSYLKPINKKDNFCKRYNAFAKRILKPLPTPKFRSTYTPLSTTRSWWDSDYNYWYDEPRWARWYRRYLASPHYRHYLSDYNYHVPKLLTLPRDIESIVGDKTKSIDRAYDSRSYTPDKYDPFESDSYVKSGLPNWKQYYYTHKLKSKPSKESYLQYYDPHYDFFPDAASVDSTDEPPETSSGAIKQVSDSPEQLIDEYRDAIYEDVIQDLRTKQQRPSNTFPRRRKPRKFDTPDSPTLSFKRNNMEWAERLGSTKYSFDKSSALSEKLPYAENRRGRFDSRKYDPKLPDDRRNQFTTTLSESAQPTTATDNVYRPSYSQALAENLAQNPTEYGQEKKDTVPARIVQDFSEVLRGSAAIHNDVEGVAHAGQIQANKHQSNLGTRNVDLGMTTEQIQSPAQKSTNFSESVKNYDAAANDDLYKRMMYQPTFSKYEPQYESTLKPSTTTFNNALDEELTPPRVGFSRNTEPRKVIADPYVDGPSGDTEQLNEQIKPSIPNRQNLGYEGSQNENFPTKMSEETMKPKTLPIQSSSKLEKRSPVGRNGTLQPDSRVANSPTLQYRDSSNLTLDQNVSKTRPQRVDDQFMDDSHYSNYSYPHESYSEVLASANSKPTPLQRHSFQQPDEEITSSGAMNNRSRLLRRRSSQLIGPQAVEERKFYTTPTESLNSVTRASAPLRRRSSQLITPPVLQEEAIPTVTSSVPLYSSSSRPTPLRRRSSQLITPPALQGETIPAVTSSAPQYSSSSRPAPLRRRSSQLIAPPAVEQGNMSSADFPRRDLSEQNVPSFRRPSTKLAPGLITEQDPGIERPLPYSADQLGEYTTVANVYESDVMRDPSDFSQTIYEQPREENNVEYYYDNNYPTGPHEAEQRYEDEDLSQPINASEQYDERQVVYDPYEQSYYYGQGSDHYPGTAHDRSTRPDTYYPGGPNYENYQNVEYPTEADPRTYEAYDYSNATDESGIRYTQNTYFPEEFSADENSNMIGAAELTNGPSSTEHESGEPTSIAELQPSSVNEETPKQLPETFQMEERVSAGSKMNNAQDRKKSAENIQARRKESVPRRASKISLQSSADDRRSKVQSTVGEPQRRAPKLKQVESKLRRTPSSVSRTKTPSSKRT